MFAIVSEAPNTRQ
ncbi:TPA_asm: UL24 uORF 2 RNA *1 [Human alphaherpesvirus 1]|nr:TPA_asm: UL24 uORF 2 RNA *1 [Human alphaherpesvirus 1]